MAITALTDPSTLPNQDDDQTTFDGKMAGFIRDLPLRAQQENDLAANMNAIAAGGAYALAYTVDLTATADADPGAGKLRFDNVAQNAAATLRLDVVVGGVDVSPLLDQFDASTSTVKGSIRLQKVGDQSRWLIFDVTARAAPAGYRNISVTSRGGSAANPFANGDSVMLFFQRNGDIGSTAIIQYLKASDRRTANTAGGSSVGLDITQTRVLNTLEANDITGASLASNAVTLPAGKYIFRGRAPAAQQTNHKLFLYNTTDGTYPGIGSNASLSGTSGQMSDSVVCGQLTIAGQKSFTLRHYTVSTITNIGLGASVGTSTQLEVYAELEFWKVG